MLDGYAAGRSGFDEMQAADGTVRPHWRAFIDGFAALGAEGREAAAESTRRLLRESGIAFNVHADPDDSRHAWRLDLVPVLLAEAEWDRIAAGLVQRARLIEAVLGDLYGERTLLRDGTLPPALLFGSPAFVRTSVARDGRPRRFLHAFACDLARTRDGDWVVLGDQTDTAIGNGYLLACRVATSHGLDDLFRACHTRRLASYYLALQEALQGLCRRDDGRIVLLSPGPESPSYFSHSYLARYLGYTLAQSGDLTVRDNHLYLKTLDGLQRVYVLVCKQPGHLLDPLHLPGSGLTGIPGLIHAERSGTVAIVNRPGSGVVQNHGLAPFHPGLSRRLLGEAPLLASLPTLWLGEDGQRRRVLAEPERWACVEAGTRNDPGEPSRVLDLRDGAGDEALATLARAGSRWVAVERTRLATTPSFDGERLVPTSYAVRAFVVAREDGYHVLPGGLVRLAGTDDPVTLPNGFGSKDLWIAGSTPERRAPSILRASMSEVHLRRTGRDLLSRTADNLFWLGRYSERAEATMRLLRCVLLRLLEDGRPDSNPDTLRRLLLILADRTPERPASTTAGGWAEVEELVEALLVGPRTFSLRDSLDQLQRTATRVRDQISDDAWRVLNALHLDRRWRRRKTPRLGWATLELLDDGIRALNAFSGTESENMTRNFAWRLLEMGRRLERAGHLAELTRSLVPGTPDLDEAASLRLLLELGESFMTYRSRYLMTPLAAPVLDLLLLDETNPRGVAFQLRELEGHLAALPSDGPHRSPGQRLALQLLTKVRLAEVDQLTEADAQGRPSALEALLAELVEGLPQLSELIGRSYFVHVETPVVTLTMRRREEA